MTWRAVARPADAARAKPWLPMEIDGKSFVLALSGDAWYGVEDRCAHAGCPFSTEGSLEGGIIICNCHGSEYDLVTGEVLRGPAEYAVRTIPVRVVGDAIEVDL